MLEAIFKDFFLFFHYFLASRCTRPYETAEKLSLITHIRHKTSVYIYIHIAFQRPVKIAKVVLYIVETKIGLITAFVMIMFSCSFIRTLSLLIILSNTI